MADGPIDVLFVCGGKYHDFDFARLEVLKLTGCHPRLRVRVLEDYRDTAAIAGAHALISYTCDVRPSVAEQEALATFVERGGRWFALHATNSVFDWTPEGRAVAPRTLPRFMQLLGSQFIAHPPLMEFEVLPTEPDHPLVAGIGPFRITDELYLAELHGPLRVLLHCHYNGKAQGAFVEREWFSDEPRPVMYLRAHGGGEVLYLTPGHCRGHYDMRPLLDYHPSVDRCAWESPVYRELLERGIRWVAHLEDAR